MIIIFTGPTSVGKTTQMILLYSRMKNNGTKCHYDIARPYGGLAHILLKALSRLLIYAYQINPASCKRKSHMAIVEITNPKLLAKLISLIITMDFISVILKSLKNLFLKNLNYNILIEDYIPQLIADHYIYAMLYQGRSSALNIINLERRFFTKMLRKSSQCMHIRAEEDARVSRAKRRNDGDLSVSGFYNEFVRDKLVNKIGRSLCRKHMFVDTSKHTILDAHNLIYWKLLSASSVHTREQALQ